MRAEHSRSFSGVGWVLAGGGARGAYEVGVLSYLFERVARDLEAPLPLDIVCGTSIGAIHACALANWADDPRVGMRMLARRWTELALDDVISLDRQRSFNMIRALLGWPMRRPSPDAERGGILDPRPLQMLVASMLEGRRIDEQIRAGRLAAVSVTATHVGTGLTTIFFQRAGGTEPPWRGGRVRAHGVSLTPDHALASAAIPFLFPAVRIDGELYCDGSLRQHVPLSPARNLGARALVVINPRAAVRTGYAVSSSSSSDHERAFPGPLFLLGKTLNALTLDRIDADIEHLELVNRLLGAGERRFGPRFVREINAALDEAGASEVRPIPLLQIGASEDIGKLASTFVRSPRFSRRCSGLIERVFSRLAEGEAPNEADLLSYLLFDGAFTSELIALGRRDARRRHDEIAEFFQTETQVQPRLELAPSTSTP